MQQRARQESSPLPDDTESRLLRRIFIVLAGILLIASIHMLYMAREFVLPIIMALLIAITFRPAIGWLALRGIAGWVSASVLALFLLMSGLAAGYLISGPIASWVVQAPQIQRAFMAKLQVILAPLTRIKEMTENITAAVTPSAADEAQKVVVSESNIPTLLWAAAYPAGYLVMFAASVILSLFLMASGNFFYERLINVMPTLTDKKNALRLVRDVEREVSTYLLTLTAINAGVGAFVGFIFYSLGMPSAHLWVLFVFILNFVPYAGPLVGVALSAVTAIVAFDSVGYALLAPLVYTAVITIENQFVSPYVLSRRLEINSIAILVAFAFFAWLWGIAGIVVSVPLLVTLRVFSLHIDALRGVGEFLSQNSLLAADKQEEGETERQPSSASGIRAPAAPRIKSGNPA
jgi:predicted PurR-regulated permease PerM